MLKAPKALLPIFLTSLITCSSAFAEQDPPTFPTFSAENPQSIGFISKLSAERRAVLVKFLDEADTSGFFTPKIEARGQEEFGIVLYILSNWDEAQKLPSEILPPNVANQLLTINPAFYRYALPARRSDDKEFVLMFYLAHKPDDEALQCLAQDLVVTLESGFDPNAVAPCVRRKRD